MRKLRPESGENVSCVKGHPGVWVGVLWPAFAHWPGLEEISTGTSVLLRVLSHSPVPQWSETKWTSPQGFSSSLKNVTRNLTAPAPAQIFPRPRNPLNAWCLAPNHRFIWNRCKYQTKNIHGLCPATYDLWELGGKLFFLWALVSPLINLVRDRFGKTEESFSERVSSVSGNCGDSSGGVFNVLSLWFSICMRGNNVSSQGKSNDGCKNAL